MKQSQRLRVGTGLLLIVLMFVATHTAANPCAKPTPAAAAVDTRVSEAIPFGKGLLWKIERSGNEPSYLFGTLHLESPRVTKLPKQVHQVFSQARSFTTEVVMHPAARAFYASSIQLPADKELRAYLDNDLYDRLVKLSEDQYQISEPILSKLKPWVVFTYLSRPRPVTGRTLDNVLEELAMKQRKSVDGLESIEEIVNVMDTLPLDDQIAILEDSICNYDTIVKQWSELIELYLQRDLAGLVALNMRPHDDEALFEALMERTLYQRNRRMVERMQELLKEGEAFIGVGALHLPGERGLLALLQSRGFSVSPVF